MAARSAGKILPTPKGEYNSAVTYEILDLVTYGNKLWCAVRNDVTGITPSEEAVDDWSLLIDGIVAQTFADKALDYATAASLSASNAATSETNAKTSETNAANSASAAASSESNSAKSETNAKTSETNAANSASNAATSETNAKTSETNAANSASAAASSKTQSSEALSQVLAKSQEITAAMEAFQQKLADTTLYINADTGNLEYTSPNYAMNINEETGNLEVEVT